MQFSDLNCNRKFLLSPTGLDVYHSLNKLIQSQSVRGAGGGGGGGGKDFGLESYNHTLPSDSS